MSTSPPPSRNFAARWRLRSTRARAVSASALVLLVGAIGWQLALRPVNAVPEPPITVPAALGADTLQYPDGAPELSMIRFETVQAERLPMTEPLPARLGYDEDVTARVTTAFSGRIVQLIAASGDTVTAQQSLAVIDSPDFGTALSELRKAQADETLKRLAHQRSQELLQGEVIPLKEFEQTRADLAQARAETQRADQLVRSINTSGSNLTGQRIALVSPIQGVVTERHANPAMQVDPSLPEPLFVVTDPQRLWLTIDLPERLLSRARLQGTVRVTVDAYPEETFDATIMQIGLVIDPGTRRVPVRARVSNPELKLKPEMFARASLVADETKLAVRVSNTALFSEGLYSYVLVEIAPGRLQKRRVQVQIRGERSSHLADGLRAGETIVSDGALLLATELPVGLVADAHPGVATTETGQ